MLQVTQLMNDDVIADYTWRHQQFPVELNSAAEAATAPAGAISLDLDLPWLQTYLLRQLAGTPWQDNLGLLLVPVLEQAGDMGR